MEVKGKIIVALPEQGGTSRSGNAWKKKAYVLETQETYPKKIHFELFGERADQYPLNIGDEIVLSFDIDSHEYQGRWYTSIRGWKVDRADSAQTQAAAPAAPAAFPGDYPPAPADLTAGGATTEDLPF